jgi:hypothetical protein
MGWVSLSVGTEFRAGVCLRDDEIVEIVDTTDGETIVRTRSGNQYCVNEDAATILAILSESPVDRIGPQPRSRDPMSEDLGPLGLTIAEENSFAPVLRRGEGTGEDDGA